jgi:hypothetical protein
MYSFSLKEVDKAHCNAVLLPVYSFLGILLVMWVNQLFYLRVPERIPSSQQPVHLMMAG